MISPSDALSALTAICDEAARLYGDDWAKVEAHVQHGLAALDEQEREELRGAFSRILSFQPPVRAGLDLH